MNWIKRLRERLLLVFVSFATLKLIIDITDWVFLEYIGTSEEMEFLSFIVAFFVYISLAILYAKIEMEKLNELD